MKRLDFIFFDAGGGHRSAATAVQTVAEQQERPWQVRLVNLQEVLDPIDIVRRLTGIRIQDTYNFMLRKGWTVGSAQMLKALHACIRLYDRPIVRVLEKTWRERQPDMVVSFVPHFNRALAESFQRVFPERPFATVLTDFADYPPHFWIERQTQFLICGTERAVEQARALGHPPERVFRTSGMILQPRFYDSMAVERGAERQRLGLEAELPTALLLFGGHGAEVMRRIVERLDQSGLAMQIIAICGKNERLAEDLKRRRWRLPVFVEGFTREIPFYMRLADFFIGKPGPGSISEALAMNLPVIVEMNLWTMPQERFNVEWVRQKGVGAVVSNFSKIVPAVSQLLEPANLARYRANAAAIQNRAVFEIPEILGRILESEEKGIGSRE